MTPKEIVLGGYQSFSEGDLESLGKIFHENDFWKLQKYGFIMNFKACFLEHLLFT